MILERLSAQLLAGEPARDPVEVTQRLLAVQGQDGRGVRLAVRARSTGLTAADVDRCLTDERSLIITWVNRGTLHLVRAEDYPWLQLLTTPPLHTGNARRLRQEGVSPRDADRAVEVIERAIAEDGPRTREQLRDVVDEEGIPTAGQALIHILFLAALRGLIVRGPMIGKQHAYVLVRDWLPKPPRVDLDQALAELARRYLAGHGPAGDRDLAKWAGLPLRDARAGLSQIAPECVEHDGGLLDLRRRAPVADELPRPRLLGSYEPVLLGWTTRDVLADTERTLLAVNGLLRPFALAGGRAVATWRMPAGTVELEPFAPLAKEVAAALEEDAADVERFLG